MHVDSRFQLSCMLAVMFLTPICVLCFCQPKTEIIWVIMVIGWFYIGCWLTTGAYKLGKWLRKEEQTWKK